MAEDWPPKLEVEIDPDIPGEVAVSIGGRYSMGMPIHQAREMRDGLIALDLGDGRNEISTAIAEARARMAGGDVASILIDIDAIEPMDDDDKGALRYFFEEPE